MVKQDIVVNIAERTGVNQVKAAVALETILGELKAALVRGERIELRGFGVFTVKARKTGIGRNPKTGETVPIIGGRTIRFKPGKELRSKSSSDGKAGDVTSIESDHHE